MENCKNCGIHLEYNNHNENTCDFTPIDLDNLAELTYVEDIKPVMLIKSGYGVYELAMIHDIMKKLIKKGYKNFDLFNEAEKIFKEQWGLK